MLVTRILDSAAARGLPMTTLIARVREGIQRQVPGPRIVVVAKNYAAALAGAQSALGRDAERGELQSGAEAILAGAPIAALRELRAARATGTIAEPLLALADLATHGVAPKRASAALAAVMLHDPSDAPIRALRTEVIRDIVGGMSPDAALAGRLGRMQDGATPAGRAPLGNDSISARPRTPSPTPGVAP
jgi:hypothetical protein